MPPTPGSSLAPKLLAIPAVAIIVVWLALVVGAGPASAEAPVNVGSAASFGVLAGTTVTNTGSSIVAGDVGAAGAGDSVTGFPPGVAKGTIYLAGATTTAASRWTSARCGCAASGTVHAARPM